MTSTKNIKQLISVYRIDARQSRLRGDWQRCWQLLEDAHVLSQPWAWPHIQVHGSMLVAGWRLRDAREVCGQILRLVVGGPASAVGRYPVGNTGRARIPATQPMPIAGELAEVLQRAGQRIDLSNCSSKGCLNQ